MNITTALNKKYIPYTIVMLTSLCEHQTEHIDAYLLHHELDFNDLMQIDEALFKYDITLHSLPIVQDAFIDSLPRNIEWSIETYYRLMLLDILPKEVERILYIDVDMIIHKDITDLFYTNMHDFDIMGVEDIEGENRWAIYNDYQKYLFSDAIKSNYKYINAGFLLMNIKKLREKFSFQSYVNAIYDWNFEMIFFDQDILNYVHWKNIGYLDSTKYNVLAAEADAVGISYEEIKERAAVIHFVGKKPWANDGIHYNIQKLWWDYAKLTPIYQSLLEEFVESSVNDPTIENWIRNMCGLLEEKKNSMVKAVELLAKLNSMINK